jgi:hypothetical protein
LGARSASSKRLQTDCDDAGARRRVIADQQQHRRESHERQRARAEEDRLERVVVGDPSGEVDRTNGAEAGPPADLFPSSSVASVSGMGAQRARNRD